MEKYHKIQTVFLRDLNNKKKYLIEGMYSKSEFEYLKDNKWIWIEKIDGTNIRILWNGSTLEFRGKTDDAQIPTKLHKKLNEIFNNEKMKETFPDNNNVCLYGEGYGMGIQKGGGNYNSNNVNFILFDCFIDGWWLKRKSLEDISTRLCIDLVPILGTGTINEAIETVKKGFLSTISENKSFIAEGLILKPEIELFDRKGDRIITKIKHRDFKK